MAHAQTDAELQGRCATVRGELVCGVTSVGVKTGDGVPQKDSRSGGEDVSGGTNASCGQLSAFAGDPSGAQRADYFVYSRGKLLRFLLDHVAPRGRALDIGCAEGLLGEALLREGFREVWGVEPIEKVARQAGGRLSRVVCGRFPQANADYGGLFDCIVLADSLEHMEDPWRALLTARQLLAANGSVILSVPNVSHLSVILRLIRGRWTYRDAGLLDRTHLRFFTPLSLRSALADAGLIVGAMQYRRVPLPRRYRPFEWLIDRWQPHFLCYQMYVFAQVAEQTTATTTTSPSTPASA